MADNPEDLPPGYDPEIVWDGLGFVPFAIVVHFTSDPPEAKLIDEEIAFYEKNGIPYRTLRDGQVLVVNGDRQQIV
jgi:dipeptidase E